MSTVGIRTTKNINQDRRVFDVSNRIALLQPSKAPLTTLLRKIGKDPCFNPVFHWFEDDLQGRWDAANGAKLAADTTITVDTGALFSVGDVVKVPRTGEVMRVTAVAGNNLTVVRGYGVTDAAAINDNDQLVIIGNAIKEAGDPVEAKGTKVTTIYNYTQIFKTSVKTSKTQEASKLYGGSDRAYQRRKKAIEHAVDIERAFLFGEKSEHVQGEEIIRTTGGVLSFLTAGSSNVLDVSTDGVLTEGLLEEYLETLFRYGSGKKVCLASPRLISVLNSYGRDKIQMNVGGESYGLQVMKYISAHGELMLVKHHLLEGDIYGKYGIILDLEEDVKYRPLQGRDTKLNTNIEPNGADYFMDEYLTEAGLMLKSPKKHGIIMGVNASAQ